MKQEAPTKGRKSHRTMSKISPTLTRGGSHFLVSFLKFLEKTMKLIAFSDIHIPYTSQNFLFFVDKIINNPNIDLVVGVGDILDMVRCDTEDILGSKIGVMLLLGLKRLILKKKTRFVPGNHDPELGKTLTALLGIDIAAEDFILDGFQFTHGYQFDPLCSWAPWKWLKKVAPFFFRTPRDWKERNREKWQEKIGVIYGKVYSYLEKRTDLRGVVMGHTHYPSIHYLETSQVVFDCGDGLDSESCLFLDTVSGVGKIIHFAQENL